MHDLLLGVRRGGELVADVVGRVLHRVDLVDDLRSTLAQVVAEGGRRRRERNDAAHLDGQMQRFRRPWLSQAATLGRPSPRPGLDLVRVTLTLTKEGTFAMLAAPLSECQ